MGSWTSTSRGELRRAKCLARRSTRPRRTSTARASFCRCTPSQAPSKRAQERVAAAPQSLYPTLFPKAMAMERAFAKAGGTLIAGTDPTGSGGVVPGYSDQRQLELLVEEGFT